MPDFDFKFDDGEFIAAYARLKQIPLAKVIRNATKDFVQAAYKVTPLARTDKSQFFVYKDSKGQRRFLHESQVSANTKLHRVRIAKGWSKASWIGIMRSLGMTSKSKPAIVPNAALTRSDLRVIEQPGLSATAIVTDEIRFDRFGKTADTRLESIAQAGFKLAAERITKDFNRNIQKLWGNK